MRSAGARLAPGWRSLAHHLFFNWKNVRYPLAAPSMSRHRNYFFTWFFPTVEEDFFLDWVESGIATYVIVGDETAPSTGNPHYQGYVEWKNARTENAVRKINKEIHWEVAQGTAKQNKVYNTKESLLCEYGTPGHQGSRTDILNVKKILLNGGSMRDVVLSTTSYQAARFGELFRRHIPDTTKRNWKPEVYWFWGPTGTGKSGFANKLAPDAWTSGRTLEWWEGYSGQSDVIIDDFRKDFCTFHDLLRIIDRYPYKCNIKFSSHELLAKRIFITSCYPPTKVYETREDLAQLVRRIDRVVHFDTRIDDISELDVQKYLSLMFPSADQVEPPISIEDSVQNCTEVGGNTIGPDFDILGQLLDEMSQ